MKKRIISISIILLVVIGIIIIISNSGNLGDEAVKMVERHLKENNIVVNGQMFIKLENLKNKSKFNKCQKGSGVLVSHGEDGYSYTPYLKCDNYVSKVNTIDNALKGPEISILNSDEVYIDLNSDNIDNIISEDHLEGITVFSYLINHRRIKRVILYTDDKTKNIDGTSNDEYPILNLKNGNNIYVNFGSSFIDPGFDAVDKIDGVLTDKVVVNGEVDTGKVGNYKLIYYVFNSKGNYVSKERNVMVVENTVDYTVNLYLENENITKETNIILEISGGGYKYTKLPDGKTSNMLKITYSVSSNGKYSFEVFDLNNRFKTYELVVNNIDNAAPTGTCTATVKSSSLTIDTNIKDNDKIANYNYIINDKSVLSEKSSIQYNGSFNKNSLPSVFVEVSDMASNSTKITCKIVDKTTPNIVNDINGYSCLEGFVCYKQGDYRDPYQATLKGPGPISSTGCLPTSLAILSTYYNKRSSNGSLFTPSTLVKELIYVDGKITGYSDYGRVVEVLNKLNLNVSSQYNIKSDTDILKRELHNGNVIIANTNGGCFSPGAHYLTIIGINDKDEIFISDPFRKDERSYTTYAGQYCTVNTWSNINDLIRLGGVSYFAVVSE